MSTVILFPARRRPAGRVGAIDRAAIEAALEKTLDVADHLVAQLDRLDGDPELEADVGQEPSLGAPVSGDSQALWAAGGNLDLESAATRNRAAVGSRSIDGQPVIFDADWCRA